MHFNNEIVVLVTWVDYIRTFTWDKKLEMLVKSQLGGQGRSLPPKRHVCFLNFSRNLELGMTVVFHFAFAGKMPTVVSPELYRGRYLEAMDRYFLTVPDRWTGLGKNVDS